MTLALIWFATPMNLVFLMLQDNEILGRQALKIAGTLDEIQLIWLKRVEEYFIQLESLVKGEWFDSSDLIGIIREAYSASKEALKGLGTDLSAELLHSSSGILSRFQSERSALLEEINDLRESYARAISRDGSSIRQENETLIQAIKSVPMFKLLATLQDIRVTNYKELTKKTGMKRSDVRKYIQELVESSYASLDKSKKPHEITFVSAPWSLHSFHVKGASSQLPLTEPTPLSAQHEH